LSHNNILPEECVDLPPFYRLADTPAVCPYNGAMRDRVHNLAIETAGAAGSLALGRGDELLDEAALPSPGRHRIDLMPAIDALCRKNGVDRGDIGELCLSIGPGSFTGLRIGVATAKMLAYVLALDVVAVPTLDVVAQNAFDEAEEHLAVCMCLKREITYQGLYRRDGDRWVIQGEPRLATLTQLLDTSPRPLSILGEPLGALPQPMPKGVMILRPELAIPQARHVWRLGREKAKLTEFADPISLTPLYASAPEAEQQWNRRYGESATIQTRLTSDRKTP